VSRYVVSNIQDYANEHGLRRIVMYNNISIGTAIELEVSKVQKSKPISSNLAKLTLEASICYEEDNVVNEKYIMVDGKAVTKILAANLSKPAGIFCHDHRMVWK